MVTLGTIDNQTVERVITGDITINGDINGNSVVSLVSTGGTITLNGKVDGSSLVYFTSLTGAVVITDKIDGSSSVTITGGAVSIGATIQERALSFSTAPHKALLHWGLENDKLTAAHLAHTPLGQFYKAGMTRLETFRTIRTFLKAGHAPVFDNRFTARLGL